jgi:hypothetical protein
VNLVFANGLVPRDKLRLVKTRIGLVPPQNS